MSWEHLLSGAVQLALGLLVLWWFCPVPSQPPSEPPVEPAPKVPTGGKVRGQLVGGRLDGLRVDLPVYEGELPKWFDVPNANGGALRYTRTDEAAADGARVYR